jgi:plastocyanin
MSRSRTVPALALTTVLVVAIPALATGSGRSAGAHTVVLHNIRFHPGTLAIKRGESVTWVWRDGTTEHNVTARGFHSKTQNRGSFTVRFTHTGTFNYRCTIHELEGMRGKVIVH